MNVLQLGPIPPPHGGVQTNLMAIRDLVRRRGGRAFAANITRNRQPDHDDLYFPESPGALLKLLFGLPYEILHLHVGGFPPSKAWALAFAATCVPGKRTVFSFHSGGYAAAPEGRSAGWWTMRGAIFRRFDRIVVVNREMVDLFRRFGVREDRIRFIYPQTLSTPPHGIELTEPLRSFFATHDPVLLSVGLLENEYDLPLQIEAMERIRVEFPNAGLAMIGSGSHEAALRERIASKAYREHLLLAGDVPHPVTLKAIQSCRALLRTTLFDGDAVSVREALFLRTPVIATDNGMRPEGPVLIPASNADALCEAVARVVRAPNPERRTEGRDESNIEKVAELYEELQRR